MEYRRLGRDGPTVSALSFGTATFGGVGRMFRAWGTTETAEAQRPVDICIEVPDFGSPPGDWRSLTYPPRPLEPNRPALPPLAGSAFQRA